MTGAPEAFLSPNIIDQRQNKNRWKEQLQKLKMDSDNKKTKQEASGKAIYSAEVWHFIWDALLEFGQYEC